MKKIKKEQLVNIVLAILIIIQPILEIYYINNENFEFFGFQISTIIRFLLFGLLSLLVIINYKKLKRTKSFIIYLSLVLLYFIFHHLNALNFTSYVPGNFNYSIIEEIFYMMRMLIPIFLIYYVYNFDFDEKKLNKSIYIVVGFITLSIIISNIFKFSIGSYNDEIIHGNIFDWFLNPNKYGYLFLASRGIFSDMIISYLVILFTPYLIYKFYNEKKVKAIIIGFLLVCSLLCGFIVGTKSTTLGIIIVMVCGLLLSGFLTIIKKEINFSFTRTFFITFLIIISFFMIEYSPMLNRNITDIRIEENKQQVENNSEDKEQTIKKETAKKYLKSDKIEKETEGKEELSLDAVLEMIKDENAKKEILIDVLSEHYSYYGINVKFIGESYSYKYDPFFWKEFVDNTYLYERSNNRMVVQKIFDRILQVNNNNYDKYFGITYSRTSKVFNLERDFLYQYYSMGLIGSVLLLGPYIITVLISGVYMLIHFKDKFTFKNCSLMLGIGLVLCLAFYSGNTIENLAITIPLGIICGYLLKNVLNNQKTMEK